MQLRSHAAGPDSRHLPPGIHLRPRSLKRIRWSAGALRRTIGAAWRQTTRAARPVWHHTKRLAGLATSGGRALCSRHADAAARGLGFVPPFGVGCGLVGAVGAKLLHVPHPVAFALRCGAWAAMLALGVGLLLLAGHAFRRALGMEERSEPRSGDSSARHPHYHEARDDY